LGVFDSRRFQPEIIPKRVKIFKPSKAGYRDANGKKERVAGKKVVFFGRGVEVQRKNGTDFNKHCKGPERGKSLAAGRGSRWGTAGGKKGSGCSWCVFSMRKAKVRVPGKKKTQAEHKDELEGQESC